MSKTNNEDEIELAQQVQEQTVVAMHSAMKSLLLSQIHLFPDNPLTLPTLHLSAICHYINHYISTFPEEVQKNVMELAYETIGFIDEDEEDDDNDLKNMRTVGTA